MLFTGYFEPELRGSRTRTGRFQTPLYARPEDAPKGTAWLTRAQIEQGALAGQGLELAWVDDPVAAFFLQIQGSGRVTFTDGTTLRVGYGGSNGHNYRSIGKENGPTRFAGGASGISPRDSNWVKTTLPKGGDFCGTIARFVFFRPVDVAPERASWGIDPLDHAIAVCRG